MARVEQTRSSGALPRPDESNGCAILDLWEHFLVLEHLILIWSVFVRSELGLLDGSEDLGSQTIAIPY